MTVELRTHAARERAAAERERIERKAEGFEAFARRVRDVSADGGRAGGSRPSSAFRADGGALAVGASESAATGAAEPVREAFDETVLPHVDAATRREAMADELSPELAAALSPAGAGFAPGLKARLLSRADERRTECRLLADAAATERERLAAVADELDEMTGWVAKADETPLLQLGFEELRERHDRLESFREICGELARDRQATLRGTHHGGGVGVRERDVLDLLYADFAVDHPVLADLAKLDALLADCQRAVRRHLCRRV